MSMEYSLQLTEKQKALHSRLLNAICCKHGVADILSNQSEEDIEAVLTTLYWKKNDIHRTLPALAALLGNTKALKDILNAVSKIPGLEQKTLTNVQTGKEHGEYTLLRIASLHPDAFAIIKNRMIERGFPIPQKQQGSIAVTNNPESPFFLSQQKGKILAAVAGLGCAIVGVVLLNAGNPLGGIALLAGALLLLASTKKGQEIYGEVGKILYNVLPECFKSKEPAKG